MRATKVAIAAALAADPAVAALVPGSRIYAVERATIPALPAVEVIGITSERIGDGPLIRHAMNVEVTVSHQTEDGADLALDAIVAAVRARLSASEESTRPIALASGSGVVVQLGATRWSVSAADKASVIRGGSIAVTAAVGE